MHKKWKGKDGSEVCRVHLLVCEGVESSNLEDGRRFRHVGLCASERSADKSMGRVAKNNLH